MTVRPEGAPSAAQDGEAFFFCSELCRRSFIAHPDRYVQSNAASQAAMRNSARRIAYFSMEVGLDPRLPVYSGGLGVLAADTLRACADLGLPVVGVSLLYRRGYFDQRLDARGNQQERPAEWDPASLARPLPAKVPVVIEGRTVVVRAWRYDVKGLGGCEVPLILLDTDCPENGATDRELTASLYSGDERHRLAQEVVLGIGGLRMLRALGYSALARYHMNEGHASLLALELLRERAPAAGGDLDYSGVRERCIFTTHTPVPAGHDQFPYDLVASVLGEVVPLEALRMLAGRERLNMTLLALNLSRYVNGVAKRHGQVTQEMFPGHAIDSITNGVHSFTWTCESFRDLFDRYIPGWAQDPASLRSAVGIPNEEIWDAHLQAKRRLVAEVERRTGASFSDEALTVGIARRATEYKRLDLVLSQPERLREIAETVGPLQLVFAGKAHPSDGAGKEAIRRVVRAAEQLKDRVRAVYLENYDLELARLLTSGSDLWLNTPLPPQEASGTSGKKAAHNGVPSLSILDGWWLEGHIEGVTGWSIGPGPVRQNRPGAEEADARELYAKLQVVIAPLFYRRRALWTDVMRTAIAFNASFFNTHRMVQQYAANAYV